MFIAVLVVLRDLEHMVDRLIAAGADVYLPCATDGRTVLDAARYFGINTSFEIVQKLRAAKAAWAY